MAKSEIIKQLATGEINLEMALKRTRLLLYSIGNDELAEWVSNEIKGYSDKTPIPTYRNYSAVNFIYSGINGRMQVSRTPLPIYSLHEKTIKEIRKKPMHEGIATLYSYKELDIITQDYTMLAPMVANTTGIQCTSIFRVIGKDFINTILETVEEKLTNILLSLEEEYGQLDSLDIDVSSKNESTVNEINNYLISIVFDESIEVGDSNKILKSSIGEKIKNVVKSR